MVVTIISVRFCQRDRVCSVVSLRVMSLAPLASTGISPPREHNRGVEHDPALLPENQLIGAKARGSSPITDALGLVVLKFSEGGLERGLQFLGRTADRFVQFACVMRGGHGLQTSGPGLNHAVDIIAAALGAIHVAEVDFDPREAALVVT